MAFIPLLPIHNNMSIRDASPTTAATTCAALPITHQCGLGVRNDSKTAAGTTCPATAAPSDKSYLVDMGRKCPTEPNVEKVVGGGAKYTDGWLRLL
ncbi:hypothetical protein BAUCODRAFT_412720 [Baudoinia panamericana UAMH 10762]|uniref:Uncharacterized protein n=1 Tax=Baudoinia panamericana (strain UAMH 10762) TaxID=717646 RepID=M2NFQ7_BAUPA|nr:uncharacterized protein BAUCODRAFT_412720 [Baudoinia panamericana UAMH 10762]EMC98089.1 hypothetical protein BAUCODRAFT_412720 [Baudoinia panamericana UAMH 10762]